VVCSEQPWFVQAGGERGGGDWPRVESVSTEGVYRELRPKAIDVFVSRAPGRRRGGSGHGVVADWFVGGNEGGGGSRSEGNMVSQSRH